MNRIFRFLHMAAGVAISKDDRRTYFLGAIAQRRDGTIVRAVNGPTETPDRMAHAERRLCNRLDVGSVVYVARVKRDGAIALSKPCRNCQKAMRCFGVDRVYYTIGQDEYGCLELN